MWVPLSINTRYIVRQRLIIDDKQGLVTSAQKLNRKGLVEKYKTEIEKAYGGK